MKNRDKYLKSFQKAANTGKTLAWMGDKVMVTQYDINYLGAYRQLFTFYLSDGNIVKFETSSG